MQERDTSSFRLGNLDERAEIQPAEPAVSDLRLQKLSRRITRTALLLVLLTLALIGLGYWDLHSRLVQEKSSGTREIENMATVLEDRMNQLQDKLSGLEQRIQDELAKVDKLSLALNKDLGELRAGLKAIDVDAAVKAEGQAMETRLNKAVADIKARSESMAQTTTDLEKDLKTRVAPLEEQIAQLKNSLSELQQRIGKVAGGVVGRDDLDLELLKVKNYYQQQISTQIDALRRQTNSALERLERLESRARMPSTPAPGAPASSGTGAPAKRIQEQTIQ
jgi:chromosome segregation ATPase